MHTITLVTVEVPKGLNENEELAKKNQIQSLIQLAAHHASCAPENKDDIMMGILRRRINCRRDPFSSAVDDAVAQKLEPYDENCSNLKYLEFHDENDALKDEWENGTLDCIKTPDGRIIPVSNQWKFIIYDGKVFERNVGPLRHEKRTKKAKKHTALPEYPIKKVYHTLEEYAEDYQNFVFNEDKNAWGYYTNKYGAFWDWYAVGGRWPTMFLVKSDCPEYSIGDIESEDSDNDGAPEGYHFAVAARKKDIQWQAYYEWRKKSASERFFVLKDAFESKSIPEGFYAYLKEDGIYTWNGLLYKDGESLDEYLKRLGYNDNLKYHAHGGAYLDMQGVYHEGSFASMFSGERDDAWSLEMEKFVDEIPDDTIIVAVDCHN